jgi:hypothetical protein
LAGLPRVPQSEHGAKKKKETYRKKAKGKHLPPSYLDLRARKEEEKQGAKREREEEGRCHTCGGVDHFASVCPLPKKVRLIEEGRQR